MYKNNKTIDNKIKYAIIAFTVTLITIIVTASMFGNASNDDPTHIIITVLGYTGELETSFSPLTWWGNGNLNFNPLI